MPEQQDINQDSYAELLIGAKHGPSQDHRIAKIKSSQAKDSEESYKELYLGKKKDLSKDPRWHAVKGMGIAIGMMSGCLEKAKSGFYFGFDYNETQQIIDYCMEQIPILADKKEKLKAEIKEEMKRKKVNIVGQ